MSDECEECRQLGAELCERCATILLGRAGVSEGSIASKTWWAGIERSA